MTLLAAKATLWRSSQEMESAFWPEDYIPLLIPHRWITIPKEEMYLLTICSFIPASQLCNQPMKQLL